jgi:hypothetical protein
LFLCLDREIPASSAVKDLRIECVEAAKQLDFRFSFPRGRIEYSNRAGECRSKVNLSCRLRRRGLRPCQTREAHGAGRTSTLGAWLKGERRAGVLEGPLKALEDKAQEG